MAITRADLAQLLHELGRSAEAEAELEQALPAFAQLVAAYPQVPRYYEEQAACRDVLGQVLGDLGRNEEAKTACQFAVEAYQQLVSVYPDVPQYRERLAVGRGHLGQVLHKLGDRVRAAETYRQAIESLEELIQIAPKILSYRNGAAFVYRHFGTLLQETEDAAEAEKAFRRANELWQELAGQSPAPQYLHNLARFLVSCTDPQFRDPQQAIELVTRAKEQSPQNAAYWNTLGAAHYRAGDWHQSIAAVREAIKCRQKGHARDWFFLGMAQRQAGQSEEAAESYRRGCQWMQDNCPDRPELKTIRGEAAQLLGLSEKQAAAEDQSGRLQ